MMGMNETLAGVTIVVLGNASPDIAGGFAAFGQMNGETSRIVFNSLLRYPGLKFAQLARHCCWPNLAAGQTLQMAKLCCWPEMTAPW